MTAAGAAARRATPARRAAGPLRTTSRGAGARQAAWVAVPVVAGAKAQPEAASVDAAMPAVVPRTASRVSRRVTGPGYARDAFHDNAIAHAETMDQCSHRKSSA